jgi:hypothetical protein
VAVSSPRAHRAESTELFFQSGGVVDEVLVKEADFVTRAPPW